GPVAVRLLVRALSASVRWRWVASSTTKGTLAAPSLTTETSARFEPVTVTVSPARAGLGEELASVGRTLNAVAEVQVRNGVVTVIVESPGAPLGTDAVIFESETTVKDADTPPN